MSSTPRSLSPAPCSSFSSSQVPSSAVSSSSSSQALSAEERERRVAEERAAAALKLQRKQRLDALVRKRIANLKYLQKVHEGGCFWLNTVLFTLEDIKHYARTVVPRARVLPFFYLGLSVSSMLSLNPGTATVRAFSQLLEEWEYFHAGGAVQGMKYVMAKSSPCLYPQSIPSDGSMADLARPSLYKFNNNVVYEYLQVVPVAFELDYLEVMFSLCEALFKLYEKLFHVECFSNQMVYDTIIRLDSRIKHHLINLVAKELTELADCKTRLETGFLRSLTEDKSTESALR